MRKWIILITVNGDRTGEVGPFDAECVADMYVEGYLKPAMPEAIFLILELTSPQAMFEALGEPEPKLNYGEKV